MKNAILSIGFVLISLALQAQKPDISYVTPQSFNAGTAIVPLAPVNVGGVVSSSGGSVSTLAGSTTSGFVDGTGAVARFNQPTSVVVDKNGNIYVADKFNHRIRMISGTGEVSTFAGSGTIGSADGQGTAASFYYPTALALDHNGNVYVSDQYNHKIRKITKEGIVSTFAGSGNLGSTDGISTLASFNNPEGLVVDSTGTVYVADLYNHKIRKISSTGEVITFAGTGNIGSNDGTGTSASFYYPSGLVLDAFGSLYVADHWNNKIRKITPLGVVSTFAGSGSAGSANGTALTASFDQPYNIVIDRSGNLIVTDRNNNKIRKITPDGIVSTLAGDGVSGSTDGSSLTARFYNPFGIAVDGVGNFIIADRNNHEIRKYTSVSYTINPPLPTGLNFDVQTGIISGTPQMGQPSSTYQITAKNDQGIDTTSLTFSVIANTPKIAYSSPQIYTNGVAIVPLMPVNTGGNVSNNMPSVSTIAGKNTSGLVNGVGSAASFNYPTGVVLDKSGAIFVTDKYNHVIRKISPTGEVSTFAGSGSIGSSDGQGSSASFYYPSALTIDANENLFVSDQYNHKIRKITKTGLVSTIAGIGYEASADGPAASAGFYRPEGIALDSAGNIFVADYNNNKIRKITPAGVVSTFAGSGSQGSTDGTGTSARFYLPCSIAIDASGTLYVADQYNNKIRKVTSAGVVTTIAGTGASGSADGAGSVATFNYPSGILLDASGNLLVADKNNNKIRKISPSGLVSTVAGSETSGSVDGDCSIARFYNPHGLAMDSNGNLIVADRYNHKIRIITNTSYSIQPALPSGLIFNPQTGEISGTPQVSQPSTSYQITARNEQGVDITTLSIMVLGKPSISTVDVTSIKLTTATVGVNILNLGAPNPYKYGICWNLTGNPTVSDSIDKKDTASVAGSSTFNMTKLKLNTNYFVRAFIQNESGISYGNELKFKTLDYVPAISYAGPQTYTEGIAIAELVPTNTGGATSTTLPQVTTIAGNTTYGFVNGTGTAASFYYPTGVAVDKSGNIFVTDKYNHVIRKISPAGEVSTFAGSGSIGSSNGQGTAASFYYPGAVVIDKDENLFISDQINMKIRKITKTGLVSTYAGNGIESSDDGPAASSSFRRPEGLVLDTAGNLYIAEYWGHKIRKISPAGIVSTLAGTGAQGSTDGPGATASFNYPCGLTIDASGTLYVADQWSNKIRKVTATGVVSTIAGTGEMGSADGVGSVATFNYPSAVLLDASGNLLVADRSSNKIRKITPEGMVSTLAGSETAGSTDGGYETARFNFPFALTFDLNGNLLVADRYNHEIRKISISGYSISPALPEGLIFNNLTGTLSGTPLKGSALKTYTITAANESGISTAMLSLTINGKSSVTTEAVSSVLATSATANGTMVNFGTPSPTAYGFCMNKKGMPTVGDSVLLKDLPVTSGTYSMLLKNLTPGVTYYVRAFSTNAYGTSYGEERSFTTPMLAPNISYLSPQIYNVGTTITPLSPLSFGGSPMPFPYVFTYSGNGVCASTNGLDFVACFANPASVAIDAQGNLFVADANTHLIRKITADGVVTTLAGSGATGAVDSVGTAASFNSPRGIAVDSKGNVYVGDTYNNKIRKITKDGVVTTLAGSGNVGRTNGTGSAANFYFPTGVAVDTIGNVYVADKNNKRLCKITPSGVVTTLAVNEPTGIGDGVGGVVAPFSQPTGVAVDTTGNVFVADYGNNQIYKYTPAGVVSVLAGSGSSSRSDGIGTSASFYRPQGLAVDGAGNVFVAEYSSNSIRKITSEGVVTTLAGISSSPGFLDGKTNIARFAYPSGIAVDKTGILFVADYGNNRIRKIGAANYSISPTLPTGLTFDVMTGTISGNPSSAINMTTFTIYAANTGGTCNTTVDISTLSSPQALNNLKQGKLSIYPNPATNQIGVKGLTENQLLTVYSLTGVKLISKEVSNDVSVDVSNLASGVYLVKVGSQDLKLVKK